MASNDLIVVIPGITGSTLTRDGTEIWSSKPATVLAALATLGKHIRKLQLPSDIGDQAPDDGVEAAALISHLHFIPGLWTPIHGYEKLVERLRTTRARKSAGTNSRISILFCSPMIGDSPTATPPPTQGVRRVGAEPLA